MKNRKIRILLAVMMGASLLTACGNKKAEEDSSSLYSWEKIPDEEADIDSTENSESDAAVSAAADVSEAAAAEENESGSRGINEASLSRQIETIAAAVTEWGDSDENVGAPVVVAVTDLDQNGRLEVIRTSIAGTGEYTTSDLWEVDEDLAGLKKVTWEKEEGDSEPDLCQNSLKLYYDPADGTYSYIVPDYIRNGAAEMIEVTDVFCLADGSVTVGSLGMADTVYTSDTESTTEYTNADGYTISEMDYNGLAAKSFDGISARTADIAWLGSDDLDGDVTGLDTDVLKEKLTNSYKGFVISD